MSKTAKTIIAVCVTLVILLATVIGVLGGIKNTESDVRADAGTRFIAHRGLSSKYYQNTEEAFFAAAQSDFFYGIETDIWRTSDGIWVCCHDDEPFANGAVKVSESTFAEIKELPLRTEEVDGIAVDGKTICTFQRYLEICAEGGKVAIIETKQKLSQEHIAEIIDFVRNALGSLRNVQFISFHSQNVERIKKLDESAVTQKLVSKKRVLAFFRYTVGCNQGINKDIASKAMIKTAQRNGAMVGIWTVNDIEEAKYYISLKVDFITTDYIFEL